MLESQPERDLKATFATFGPRRQPLTVSKEAQQSHVESLFGLAAAQIALTLVSSVS